MFETWQIIAMLATGLAAGVLGGMLGVGGSVIMIPVMAMLFGQTKIAGFNQHLYQAAAMIVNVAVVVPAAIRHRKAGAIQPNVLKLIMPFALVFILVGVWLSNRPFFHDSDGATRLGRVLAMGLVYIIAMNIRRLINPRTDVADNGRTTPLRGGLVGTVMGLVAGLMGVGGGGVAVPLQQQVMRLPLRNCIANSTAIICLTAGFGAVYKNATLAGHGLDWRASLVLAALLAPTAVLGGYLGGKLTHTLPLKAVRIAFIGLMCVAAWKMAALDSLLG